MAQTTNFNAISQIITLFVDAFNDTANAFGKNEGIGSIGDYANLLPDVMSLIGSVGDLHTEFEELNESDLASLVAQFQNKLKLPNAKAEAIVNDVLGAISAILDALTDGAANVQSSLKTNCQKSA